MYFKQDFNEKHFKATAAFQYRILLTYTLFECSNIEIITRLEYRIYILSFFSPLGGIRISNESSRNFTRIYTPARRVQREDTDIS